MVKKNKKLDINLILFLIFSFMTLTITVGYSALNQELSVSGEAVYRVEADIRITGVNLKETTNNGLEDYVKFSKDSITGGITLTNLNSTLTYEIEITNSGNVAMYIDNIDMIWNNQDIGIYITGYNEKELINPGQTKVITGVFKYNNNVTVLPDNKTVNGILKFSFKKPESILASGSFYGSTSKFFNDGPITKESVEEINFAPTLEVGGGTLGFWDASLKKDGTVIAWYTDKDNNGKNELTIGGIGEVQFAPNSSSLFYSFTNLKAINFNYVNTSNVTNMENMFGDCSSLTNLDLNSFNTSNVTNMKYMFSDCIGLIRLDLSKFNTSSVTNMGSMFIRCKNLTSLDVNKFDTSNVTSMGFMFGDCSNLTSLDLSNFNTSNVTAMSSMFSNCSSLTSLNLNSFNTGNVTNMSFMFYFCSGLTSLNVSKFDTSNVTNMENMFCACSSLTSLDVSSFNTSNVKNMVQTFSNCSSLTSLDLSNFDTSNVTDMNSIFYKCSNLAWLDIRNFNFENITSASAYAFELAGKNSDIPIYVKDQDAFKFVKSRRSDFTNILILPSA